MAGFIRTMSQAIRSFLFAITRQKHSSCKMATPAVVLHDPAAQQPHDLDDPFFDLKVQARIADVISNRVQKT